MVLFLLEVGSREPVMGVRGKGAAEPSNQKHAAPRGCRNEGRRALGESVGLLAGQHEQLLCAGLVCQQKMGVECVKEIKCINSHQNFIL